MSTITPTRPPEQALAVVPGFRGHPLHVLQIIPAEGWWILRNHGGLDPSEGNHTSRWKVPAFALAFSEESHELVLVPFRLEDLTAVLEVKPVYADEQSTRLEHEADQQWCSCSEPLMPWERWCSACGGPRRIETATSRIEDRLEDIASAIGGSGDVRVTCAHPPAPAQRDRVVQLVPVEDGPVVRYRDAETPVVAWAVYESGATSPVVEIGNRPYVLGPQTDGYELTR